MSVIDNARALLPENHKGWGCDGSASVCDERIAALRDLIAEHERLTADLDARFEHSDHTAAKYYQRMRDAEKHARMRASESADLERERDELAAVIEKAKMTLEEDGDFYNKLRTELSAVPADALREHDVALIESLAEARLPFSQAISASTDTNHMPIMQTQVREGEA